MNFIIFKIYKILTKSINAEIKEDDWKWLLVYYRTVENDQDRLAVKNVQMY